MEEKEPPIRVISLGRVYRPDAPDATHFPMFHQMEGLLVDRNVTMANLKTVLRVFAEIIWVPMSRFAFVPPFSIHRAERRGRFLLERKLGGIWRCWNG